MFFFKLRDSNIYKNNLRYIYNNLLIYYKYIIRRRKIVLNHENNKKNIILLGIPTHNNLGDEAIVIAEEKFIRDNFSSYNLIEIQEQDVPCKLKSLERQLTSTDIIFLHGGGNLGTLYPYQEGIRRLAVKDIKFNKIISFPQSIFFDDNVLREKKRSIDCYSKNKNFSLITRDYVSYKIAQKLFSKNKIYLTPDIVFYLLKGKKYATNNDYSVQNALLILRNDSERNVNSNLINRLIINVLNERKIRIKYSDTISTRNNLNNSALREQFVKLKLEEISNFDFTITDRLHGMIFSILSARPCIVLENSNSKISSTIDTWLKNCPLVFFMSQSTVTIDQVVFALKRIQSIKEDCVIKWYQELDFSKLYSPLWRQLNNEYKN